MGLGGLGAYSAVAADNCGNVCLLSIFCGTVGPGFYAGGGPGIGIGSGKLQEGKTISVGGFSEGGAGLGGSGAITTNVNKDAKGLDKLSDIGVGRGYLGAAFGKASGVISCETNVVYCWKLFDSDSDECCKN